VQFETFTAGDQAAALKTQGGHFLRVSAAATIVLALILAGFALAEVNGVLCGMHGTGQPGYGAQDIVDLLHPWSTEAQADRVAASWRDYVVTAGPTERPGPDTMIWYFVLIDSLAFAPFYAIAAAFLLNRFTSKDETETAQRRAHLARAALWGVPVALVLDIGENILVRRTATDALRDGDVTQANAYAVWALNAAKTAAIVWFLVPLVALGVLWLRDVFRRRAEINESAPGALTARTVARRLRIHLLLVLVLGALLLGHEQIPDLIRRWSPLQGLATVAFAVVFALAVWLSARWLVRSSQESELFTTGPSWLSYLVPVVILIAGFLLWVVGAGWGLIIPGVLLGLAAVLSLLSRPDEPDGNDEPDEPAPAPANTAKPTTQDESADPNSFGNKAARILAAAILVLLGIGVFHASLAQAILYGQFRLSVILVPLGVFAVGVIVGIGLQAGLNPSRLLTLLLTEPLMLGFAALATYVLLTQAPQSDTDPWLQLVLGILLAFAGWWLFQRLASVPSPSTRAYRASASVLVAGAVILAAVVVAWPLYVAPRLGGIAVLAGFLTLLTLVGTLVVRVNDGVPAPPSLAALEIKHIPLLTLLLVWFVLASMLDKGGYHDIRSDLGNQAHSVTLEQAWSCWLTRNGLDATSFEDCPKDKATPTSEDPGAVPLILVAATGGGTRAAYWTAAILDCALEASNPQCDTGPRTTNFDRSDRLFAASGISGGSLGLASYAALLAQREQEETPSEPYWYEKRLSGDALSPSVAWWLYVESVQSLLRFEGTRDRATVLEQGWESDWSENGGGDGLERGLFELWWQRSHTPLLLLNGTNVTDGCRFSVSVLDANIESGATASERIEQCRSSRAFDENADPATSKAALAATRELADFACTETGDVRLSTAALLSARFPFVSPSGRITACDDDSIVSYVVDGGYFDTSGASPLVELMKQLAPLIDKFNERNTPGCVIPFLIQIDNGPPAGAQEGTRRPLEINVPLVTLFQTRIARAANARNTGALEFTTNFPAAAMQTPDDTTPLDDRYAHFFNVDAPGPRPPLGWVMSSFSRTELRDDRFRGPNPDAFAEVRSWLGEDPDQQIVCREP
jgi:hypothetical protein